MTLNSYDFRFRRAKSGCGERKDELVAELKFQERMLTHHIIAMSAGNVNSHNDRAETEANIKKLTEELVSITHEGK